MRFNPGSAAVATLSLALLSGGGGGGKSNSGVQTRLVNASAGYSSLDLPVNSVSVNSGVAYGWPGAVKTTLLQESEVAPAAGSTKLLVLNLAPEAGSQDVYLSSSTAWLDDAPRITGVNNKADLRLDLPAITLDGTQVASCVGINARVRFIAAFAGGNTVPASTASSLSVSSPNSSTPIFSVPTLAVAPSGVYCVSLMGDSTSTVGTVGQLSKLR